ncbi:MAG: ROK family protein [Desulfobacteraceae bacterium]|nr:ROK family protein [Desulfobacteraceae bacterium]
MDYYRIGIDLGGTKTETVLIAPEGNELFRKRIPTKQEKGYSGILDAVHQLILETAHKVPPAENYTVGIGIPGSINRDKGLVHNANTTCLIGKPFQKDLETLLEKKIAMENDANCFTLIEAVRGAAKGYNVVFGVIMGTGCGGGICIDQKIWNGPNGISGEWGHFSIDPGGRKCFCGNVGCVETKISGTGVENAFFEAHGTALKMNDIVNGFRRNDPKCKKIFDQFLDDFGRVLGGLISVLDPDAVVIGGGLSNIDELYTIGAKKVLQYAFHEHVTTPILKNELGDSAGVLGAALLNYNKLDS